MLTDLVYIVLGLAGLFIGGELLIRSSSRLALGFGVPPLVIGLSVVALGTSMPELVVSLSAALGGSSQLALGNVVGSNIGNIGLILGIAGLIRPLVVHDSLIRREIPIMLAISVLVFVMALDGSVSRVEGLLLVACYPIFTYVLYRSATRAQTNGHEQIVDEVEVIEGPQRPVRRGREIGLTLIAIVILMIGAQLTVTGAAGVARAIGISELVIGLTLVAVGTSLPEIVTSLAATIRRHDDLATSNVVGSNIANLLLILGFTAIILPVPVPDSVARVDLPVMIAFAGVLLALSFQRRLPRWAAGLLLAAYAVFVVATFLSNAG
jgi:cation:H+ antiporter